MSRIRLFDAQAANDKSIIIEGQSPNDFAEVYVTLQRRGVWAGGSKLLVQISNEDPPYTDVKFTLEATYAEDGFRGFWLSAGSVLRVETIDFGGSDAITVWAAGHIKSIS